ncbi:MAG: SRPBCC family protein [Acidimicrobiales bacterium]
MVKPITFEQSRAIPVELQRAFDATLPIPLTTIFSRRYGLLPPIKQVRGQDGMWGQVGQSRVVVTTDGGTMRELLTDVDTPHSFSYRLSDITGPLRPLVDSIDGRWEFAPKGTGTLITWRWTLHPRGMGARVMPLITVMWRGYARQALELLSEQLLTPEPAEGAPD